MKIVLPKEEDGFIIKPNILHGEKVLLVTTHHMGVKWTPENAIFRSSLWRASDLFPISLSFRKFTNYGEQPAFEPLNENEPLTYVEKKDGSCLLVSKYKGKLVIRTRGTVDATTLFNGSEIAFLMKKYPKAFDNDLLNSENVTIAYEWETPSNFIVIRDVKEPTLSLTSIIKHVVWDATHSNWELDYSYMQQELLDGLAPFFGVERPQTYRYPNLLTAASDVKTWKGKEGIIVVSQDGQIFKKIKAEEYLKLHAFKSNMSVKTMRALFFELGEPSYDVVMDNVRTNANNDFETVNAAEKIVQAVFDAVAKMNMMVADAKEFVQPLKVLTRKDAAEQILFKFGKSVMSGFAFKFLDGKELDRKAKEKLLESILPNNALDIEYNIGNMDI